MKTEPTVRIFHADGVTQKWRRILVSAGQAKKFSVTETLDPMTGQRIRCVTELKQPNEHRRSVPALAGAVPQLPNVYI